MKPTIFNGFTGRLFLWFWLSLTLLLVANFFLGRYLDQSDELHPPNAEQINALKKYQHLLQRYTSRPSERLLQGRNRHGLTFYDPVTREPLMKDRQHWRLAELAGQDTLQTLALDRGLVAIGPFPITTSDRPLLAVWLMPPQPTPIWRQALRDSPHWRLMASMTLVLLLSAILARWLSRPIRQLSHATKQLGDGQLATRVKPGKGELGQLGHDFNLMAEKLQTATATQQRLLADVSHELRSPLTRLKLAADLLADQGSNSYIQRIEKECDTLEHLVDQVLTLSRLEGSIYQEQDESTDIAQQVQQAIEDWRFQTEGKQFTYDGPTQLIVDTKPQLLQRVLDNLLSNACRYAQTINVTLDSPQAGSWQLTITDNGPGVSDERLEHLFKPFYRGDPARGHQGNIGLGLAIAQAAAQTQGANLTVAHAATGGLCFTLSYNG
ncbi:ATP-binding protein [Gilvimarinus polysaccharolyticus]|uniref:ATP-binding protein n=1 Tax=Gilvimarinus polysaccharolyticus TaxID=863921 RepID=UPI00067398B9|nr:ATP-binding protein [Gilvimarinus polysaccharolyticus]